MRPSYQVVGREIVWPFASTIWFGNWLKAIWQAGPSDVIFRLNLATFFSSILGVAGRGGFPEIRARRTAVSLVWGFNTPTGINNSLFMILTGSAKSESLVMSTSWSQSFRKASTSMYVAIFTSEPFSSILITSAKRLPLAGGTARGIDTVLCKK